MERQVDVKSLRNKAVHKNEDYMIWRLALPIAGILINLALSFLMNRLGIPLLFDSIGTIAVSAISATLFTGIFTAVTTNVLCSLFSDGAIYFGFFNALLAIYTVWFARKYSFKNIEKTLIFALSVILLSALIDSFVQYAFFGEEQLSLTAQNARSFATAADIPYFASFCLMSLLINFIDKGFSVILSMIAVNAIPKDKLALLQEDSWKQKPLTEEEIKQIKEWKRDIKHSLSRRTTFTTIITSLLMVLVAGWIGIKIYFDNAKIEKTQIALNTVKFAADIIDPNKVENFIKYGKEAEGYEETYSMLHRIWEASSGIQYLYVLRIEEDGGRFIFDVNTHGDEEPEDSYQGKLISFDPEFEKYLPDLFAGKEIPPVESKNILGWMQTVYYPVRASDGSCLCYVGADISLDYMADYMGTFIIKVFMIMAGFFILIISYALKTTGLYTSFPISSIAACVDRFARSSEDQDKLDENVKTIRALDIHTGDEVEKLYRAICRMTLNQAEQMRDIRRLSESTSKMQDGLIITMADMVESRDSDTGAHVQKTAAYVKIIVEGLKKKGYYAQKITPKFMSDVVRSAPLHDVGKINIPDGVLNKPGKLTDEEFAIMKTHTTAGKKILENAISTVQGENYLKEARNMAAYHHERWDGKGYPEGLHGEVIPLSARIMAVADVFDALASPRVYKPAFPIEKALAILQEGAGSQFDAKCVEVFMDALPEVKLILKKYNPGV